jgi:hypothetical protein
MNKYKLSSPRGNSNKNDRQCKGGGQSSQVPEIVFSVFDGGSVRDAQTAFAEKH